MAAATSIVNVVNLDQTSQNSISTQQDNNVVNMDNLTDKISNASDIIASTSNQYDFIKAIYQNDIGNIGVHNALTQMTPDKAVAIEKVTDEFTVNTELTSKVASVAVAGINTLVKMQ